MKQTWDLNSGPDCRDFLKALVLGGGARITFLQQADGRKVSIDEASDAQVMGVVQELAEAKEHRHKFKPKVVQ